MWKPPEKIRFEPQPGRWPDSGEAQASRLFSPIRLGPQQASTIEMASRSWVPAMVPWRASEDGFVTSDVLDWYRRFAEGRPGAIVVEATGIRDIPSGPLMRIGDDRFIAGLSELVDTVREASGGKTRLFIQLIDFLAIRRRPDPQVYFDRYLEITERHRSALGGELDEAEIRARLKAMSEDELAGVLSRREMESLRLGYRERVTDMDLPQIRDLPEQLPGLFAGAARRAKRAGFDGVELHYAHAYTMASFLSPLNTRPDGYGGQREKRVRLPLEVFEAVRAEVGEDFAVGCRFLSEEIFEGGGTIEDACYFAQRFAEAGMDFLSLSRGGKFEDAKQPSVGAAIYPYTGRSGYECMPGHISDEKGPFGRNIGPASRIRAAIGKAGFKTPVVVAGGVHGFDQAEAILQKGEADIVALARQSLADPDWFAKVRAGRGREVRVCEYTNYCEGLDQKHKQVTCQLWDRLDLDEPGIKLAAEGKRRMVAPAWKRSGGD